MNSNNQGAFAAPRRRNSNNNHNNKNNWNNVNRAQQPNANYNNYQQHGFRNRGRQGFRGGRGRQFHQQQPRNFQQEEPNSENMANASLNGESLFGLEGGPLKLPGFYYNPETKKYFRIADDNSGISGYSRRDLEKSRRDRERAAMLASNRPRIASGSFALRPVIRPMTTVMDDLQMGRRSQMQLDRRFVETRLLNCNNRPTFVLDTPKPLEISKPASGCEFLHVTPDGKTVLGCFAFGDNEGTMSSVYVLNVGYNSRIASKNMMEKERREDRGEGKIDDLNTLGLEFEQSKLEDFTQTDFTDTFVDMTVAPIDTDVTCLLNVTAIDRLRWNGNVCSEFKVNLQPIPELSSPDSFETLSSPIYNRAWNDNRSAIWSLAWSEANMTVSFGREESTRIENILTGKSFVISSRKKNVISQQFSQDGNLLLMGLRGDEVIRADLRMNGHHITGSLKGSYNSGFIHILKNSHPECVITENFAGQLRLWDFRYPNRPLMQFKDHQNTHYRLPCFVDANERLVFAVGSDGTTRGWSLVSGDVLCAVPSPRPIEHVAHFPRIAYSENWAGRHGNAALVLAVGGQLRVHALEL
ncbi:unnamed protein product [Caenorhabditis auriculariae]|uniref:WD_REPEATS_REGION domain-containing protein n=1 Tax=Caenorhabditis auriculariae TaxID=2777116 RepID=A0A8S1HVD0_9PELO|nr:unnamed protein product [Caenorhabditis auriculariae]